MSNRNLHSFCSATLQRVAATPADLNRKFLSQRKNEISEMLTKLRAAFTTDAGGLKLKGIKALVPVYTSQELKADLTARRAKVGVKIGTLPVFRENQPFPRPLSTKGKLVFCQLTKYSYETTPFPETEVKVNWAYALQEHYSIIQELAAKEGGAEDFASEIAALLTKLNETLADLPKSIEERRQKKTEQTVLRVATLFSVLPPKARLQLIVDFVDSYIYKGEASATEAKGSMAKALCMFMIPQDPYTHYWVKPEQAALKVLDSATGEEEGISFDPSNYEIHLDFKSEADAGEVVGDAMRKPKEGGDEFDEEDVEVTRQENNEEKKVKVYRTRQDSLYAQMAEKKNKNLQLNGLLQLASFATEKAKSAFYKTPVDIRAGDAAAKVRQVVARELREGDEAEESVLSFSKKDNRHKIIALQEFMGEWVKSNPAMHARYTELKGIVKRAAELDELNLATQRQIKKNPDLSELKTRLSAQEQELSAAYAEILGKIDPFLSKEEQGKPEAEKILMAYTIARDVKGELISRIRRGFGGNPLSSIAEGRALENQIVPAVGGSDVNAFIEDGKRAIQFKAEKNPLYVPMLTEENFNIMGQSNFEWPGVAIESMPVKYRMFGGKSWQTLSPEHRDQKMEEMKEDIERMKALPADKKPGDFKKYIDWFSYLNGCRHQDRLTRFIKQTLTFGIPADSKQSQVSLKAARSVPPLFYSDGAPMTLADLLVSGPDEGDYDRGVLERNPLTSKNGYGWGAELSPFIASLVDQAILDAQALADKNKDKKTKANLQRLKILAILLKKASAFPELENASYFDLEGKSYPSEEALKKEFAKHPEVKEKDRASAVSMLVEMTNKLLEPALEEIADTLQRAEEALQAPEEQSRNEVGIPPQNDGLPDKYPKPKLVEKPEEKHEEENLPLIQFEQPEPLAVAASVKLARPFTAKAERVSPSEKAFYQVWTSVLPIEYEGAGEKKELRYLALSKETPQEQIPQAVANFYRHTQVAKYRILEIKQLLGPPANYHDRYITDEKGSEIHLY